MLGQHGCCLWCFRAPGAKHVSSIQLAYAYCARPHQQVGLCNLGTAQHKTLLTPCHCWVEVILKLPGGGIEAQVVKLAGRAAGRRAGAHGGSNAGRQAGKWRAAALLIAIPTAAGTALFQL